MVRPREFDECQALDAAMLVFWRRGFAGTSIADLVEATGVQRQSLYNTFGDKQALFARALDRYRERAAHLTAPLRAYLDGEGDAVSALRAYVLGTYSYHRKHGCGGCMMIKTALDGEVDDPAIRRAVKTSGKHTQQLIAAVCARGQAAGELREDHTPAALSQLVFALQNGLAAVAQIGASQRELEATLDLGLENLTRS